MSATTTKPSRTGGEELAPDLLERLRRRLALSPALGWLHPSLEEISNDFAVLKLPYREEISNGSGTVHGGILATLADTAVAFALSTNFDGKMGFATADMTIHFLRRARGDVWARARIVKKGQRINVGDVEIVDAQGREVARALASFLLTTSSFDYAPEGHP
ncbi:MAG: PaaI family thioesterase [Acidobacteriota bacterium]